MNSKIIDGKAISDSIKEEIKMKIAVVKEKYDAVPCLAVVLVGTDKSSLIYVNSKKKTCEYVGIKSISYELPPETSQEELLQLISDLNNDANVNGILVQFPLPKHIDSNVVIESIDPIKDVDGFHPINIGKLTVGMDCILPCTPYGIKELLDVSKVDVSGKDVVVVGRSIILGKPIALILLNQGATVTIAHSKTKDLTEICKKADILIAATGRKHLITKDMLKDGAVVIDAGIFRDEDGKIYGDVDFEAAIQKASLITPVPGGVGPMTIAMLMQNCFEAFLVQKELENGNN